MVEVAALPAAAQSASGQQPRRNRGALVRPPVALALDVFARSLAEVGRADDDDLEALRPRLVPSPRAGWDAVRVPPGTWRGYESGPEGLEIIVIGAPSLGEARREDVEGQRDWWAD